uniref:Histone H3.v1-like n=1 Tax=Nicotiana tabacum TaxID=4097 RepID=A0A1S4C8F5_TOBAC
ASSSPVPTVHVVPIIPTSIVSPSQKTTTHAPELPAKNTFKSTNIKATPRKSVKKVPDAAMQDVAPLHTLPPSSEKPPVDKFTIEKGAGDLGKEVDTMVVEPVVEGERSKEPVQNEASDGLSYSWTGNEEDDGGEKEEEVVNSHEEHDAQNIANEEEESENKGASGNEKESDAEYKAGEQTNDSAKEENHSEEEEVSESGAPSEETGEETRAQEPGSLLTPFTGAEEVSSDEDDVPLSEDGKKSRKTHVKTIKTAVSTRK